MRRLSVLLASAVMALTLIAVTAGVSAAAPNQQQPPPPDHFYGALDYSEANSTVYWATGTSKDAANQAAYDACTKDGATDCLTIVWVYNGWIAIAEDQSGAGEVGWGATKEKAQNEAVMRCESGGGTCQATGWAQQTAIDPNKQATGGYELPGP
jgi:hypothetical protein